VILLGGISSASLFIKISYPSIEEQTKISSMFENLDNLITLHQRKLFFGSI
jgi:hypothetical protein